MILTNSITRFKVQGIQNLSEIDLSKLKEESLDF